MILTNLESNDTNVCRIYLNLINHYIENGVLLLHSLSKVISRNGSPYPDRVFLVLKSRNVADFWGFLTWVSALFFACDFTQMRNGFFTLQFHVFFFSLRKNGPRIIVCSIYWSLSSYCFCTLVGQVLQTLRIPYTNLLVNIHSFLGFLA